MKRVLPIILFVLLCVFCSACVAESEETLSQSSGGGLWDTITGAVQDAWNWTTNAAEDAWDWTSTAAEDAWDWTSTAAGDAWNWTATAAKDAWNWTTGAATDAWNGVSNFFDPPPKEPGTVPDEPELPAGTNKMYLGYTPVLTDSGNGYSGRNVIDKDDPHFGYTIGKFYVSGFSQAISLDQETFIFLKNVGDNVQLHFELVKDINALCPKPLVQVVSHEGAYDRDFGIAKTCFGRGTLIVRHTDYQNNPGEPQIYTDYLSAKMNGEADTVISINEEGDYEVALDYRLRKDRGGFLGLSSLQKNYKISFKFSVRNGNCMLFPMDVATNSELKNEFVAENGFYLDLARSRYLNTNVKYITLTEGASGLVEDIRFNRPAKDGETYTKEGIYILTAMNEYTGEQTTKKIYVGTDPKLIAYVTEK